MSRTIGIFTESSDRNPEIDLCRLCREKHDCFYSIFTSNVAYNITVKDALHDLVGLQITVGDGLPTTMCPLCLKKLTEFSVFKKICLESDAVLRKSCFRSFEGGGLDDESEPCVETKDCIQDVIENTSEFACSAQMTEVFIPVPDCLLPRDDDLFHIKDESKDHLSEENNPMLYTTDPAGSDASDPLATDDLSDPVTYKCSSVKEDQISDEEGHILNDCTDGVSSKLIHQESFDQSGMGTCGSSSVKADQSSDDEGRDSHNDSTGGTTNERVPQPSDQAQAATSSQGEEVDAEGTGAIVIDLDSLLVLAKKESPNETGATEPTSMENGQLIQNRTMAMDSMTKAVDLSASERASALFALLEPKITASNSKKERMVMDKDIEKCGTHLADKMTSCSIPDDGQIHSKSKHVSIIRGNIATMTVAWETSRCDNPDSIKFFRVTDSRKSCHEAILRENKEMSTSLIKSPEKRAKSNDNSYRCFDCGDAFNTKNDLIKHLKIHFGSGNLDIDANLTIEKALALKTIVSRGETNSSHRPTSSKSLNKLICKRQGMKQNGNGHFKANFGRTREKKNVREVRKSFTVDRTSCKPSPHSAEKPYSCNECEKSFSRKSDLVLHMRTHTKEKPYSCGKCEKSLSQRSNLVCHIRTHTKEKPYSCGKCEKSFSQKSNLVKHIRTHTKEKPYSCGECEKSFSRKAHLVLHIRTHTKEKPYSCGECEKSFSQKPDLIRHIRTHTKEKPYSCNECERSFSQKGNLVNHIRTHTKEKPYSCDECEKSFSLRGNLVNHIRTHTKEKPYSCGECEKSFSVRKSLGRHLQDHTEKFYACNECNKLFSQKGNLVHHLQTHTKEKPYSCGECEKSFSKKSTLIDHIRTHTKEKPYSCGKCEKSFSQRSGLARHMRTHTKEKPYSCGECEKSFSQKIHLIDHIRTHTKE